MLPLACYEPYYNTKRKICTIASLVFRTQTGFVVLASR